MSSQTYRVVVELTPAEYEHCRNKALFTNKASEGVKNCIQRDLGMDCWYKAKLEMEDHK